MWSSAAVVPLPQRRCLVNVLWNVSLILNRKSKYGCRFSSQSLELRVGVKGLGVWIQDWRIGVKGFSWGSGIELKVGVVVHGWNSRLELRIRSSGCGSGLKIWG